MSDRGLATTTCGDQRSALVERRGQRLCERHRVTAAASAGSTVRGGP